MAARKKASAASRTIPLPAVAAKLDEEVAGIRRVAVAAPRPMVLLEPNAGVWSALGTAFSLPPVRGGFARLRPPLGAEERAREVEAACLAAGALGVKVELASKEAAVAREEEARVDPHQTSRQVVLEIGTKANSADRALLAASLEEGLAAAGL